jgi:beta-N-acetylhexosaminidase
LILTGLDGKTLLDDERLMIQSGQVGGLIILRHNVKSSDQLMTLVESVSDEHEIPLFLAVDQEGGRVQRLPLNKSDYPNAQKIGETPDIAFSYGQALGAAVKGFGLNLNLAPVMDVYSNSDNKVIGNRAFGKTPERVSAVGTEVMQGIQSEGIISCVKHFPGHGDTYIDSHVGLPIVSHNLERLMSFEWIPFQTAIESGTDMIMTAHVQIPKLDAQYPATLSKTIIQDYLRGALAYDGVVITDDLVMGAISKRYDYQEAAKLAIEAGVDVLLISDNDYVDEIQHALYTAVSSGEISEARIDKSIKRILSLKYAYLVEEK